MAYKTDKEINELLIKHIVDEYKDKELVCPLPKYISDRLFFYANIKDSRSAFIKKLQQLEDKFKKDKEELQENFKKDIEKCDHPVYNYYGDASGGNDSLTVCCICDAEI